MTHDTAQAHSPVKKLATWMLLVDGIMLLLLGAIVIIGGVTPAESDSNLHVRIFGAVLCAAGILLGIRLWSMTRDRDLHPMLWLMSIVPVVLGIILLGWAEKSLEALQLILSLALIIRGVLESSVALGRRSNPGWPFLLAHGIAAAVIGILFWFDSISTLAIVLLILFVGIDLIIHGSNNITATRRIKQQAKRVD